MRRIFVKTMDEIAITLASKNVPNSICIWILYIVKEKPIFYEKFIVANFLEAKTEQ